MNVKALCRQIFYKKAILNTLYYEEHMDSAKLEDTYSDNQKIIQITFQLSS